MHTKSLNFKDRQRLRLKPSLPKPLVKDKVYNNFLKYRTNFYQNLYCGVFTSKQDMAMLNQYYGIVKLIKSDKAFSKFKKRLSDYSKFIHFLSAETIEKMQVRFYTNNRLGFASDEEEQAYLWIFEIMDELYNKISTSEYDELLNLLDSVAKKYNLHIEDYNLVSE